MDEEADVEVHQHHVRVNFKLRAGIHIRQFKEMYIRSYQNATSLDASLKIRCMTGFKNDQVDYRLISANRY